MTTQRIDFSRIDTECVLDDSTSWRIEALCRHHDPGLFNKPHKSIAVIAQAKCICIVCPVRLDCLGASMSDPSLRSSDGIWGGLTKPERRRLRQALQAGEDLHREIAKIDASIGKRFRRK